MVAVNGDGKREWERKTNKENWDWATDVNGEKMVSMVYFEWMVGIETKNEGLKFNLTKMEMEMGLKLGPKFK